MIIAIEGIDASGKATQTKLLAAALAEKKNIKTECADFPNYKTPSGVMILESITKQWEAIRFTSDHKLVFDGHLNAYVRQCIFVANKCEQIALLRKYFRIKSGVLILDRYKASGVVYGKCDGLDPNWVHLINQALPEPDLTIYIRIEVAESWRRRPNRRDDYEKRADFLQKVVDTYDELFRNPLPTLDGIGNNEHVVVDGSGTVEEVHNLIMDKVERHLFRQPLAVGI